MFNCISYTIVLLISVSIQGYPFRPYYNQWPARLDQDDGVVQGAQGNPNVANQGGYNEPGDTPDDNWYEAQARGGPNAAPQAATTMAPGASPGDSSSSSSEEDTGTMAPSAGPIQGQGANQAGVAGQGVAGQGAADAGQNSGDVEAVAGGPVQAQPQAGVDAGANNAGDTSIQAADPGAPAALNLHSEQTGQKSSRASMGVAFTTVGLVAGVAATSIVAYKYKDAIKARMGL